MAVVVDASLIVSLVAREQRADLVQAMVDGWSASGERMHAPELLLFEMANALTKMVRRGDMSSVAVESAWHLTGELGIQYHTVTDLPSVVAMAIRMGRQSAYDAAYLTLAQQLGAEVWTLDGAFARNASSLGLSVHLLSF